MLRQGRACHKALDACRSHLQSLQQRITRVQVVVDDDSGRQVVGEVIELAAATDGHEDAGGAFVDGGFNDCDGIEDRFDGTAQIQTAGNRQTTLDALLQKR